MTCDVEVDECSDEKNNNFRWSVLFKEETWGKYNGIERENIDDVDSVTDLF